MRIPILSSLFLALFAGTAFVMNAYGWSFLQDAAPSFSEYRKTVDATFSFLAALSGIWFASGIGIRILESAFERVLRGSALARKLLPLLKYVFNVLVWGFWAVFLLSTLGVNVSALITGAGIGGLAFALASKEITSNLFGSLSLIFGKFFKISDRIRIRGFEGMVEEITLSHTRLTDKGGHTVYVPNKYLTAEPIENLSEATVRKTEFTATVSGAAELEALQSAVARVAGAKEGRKVRAEVSEVSVHGWKCLVKAESTVEDADACKAECLSAASEAIGKPKKKPARKA